MNKAIKVALVVVATLALTAFVGLWITRLFPVDAHAPLVVLAGSVIGMCGAFIILEMDE